MSRRITGRRLLAATLASLASVVGMVGTAGPVRATASFSFARLAGSNRYDTARRVAAGTFASGVATALVANGSLAHFPDALAASYEAGYVGAPILLTDANTVPAETDQALSSLHVQNVIILGQTAAVSDAVAAHLSAEHYNVSRLGGATRYDTAKVVAETPPASRVGRDPSGKPTAIVASGANFPDALVAGPLGYGKAFPVLLTDPNGLSSQTQQALSDLGVKNVLIPGGPAAVSSTVEGQIQAMGISTKRFSGQDRTDTAAQVASYAVQSLGFTNTALNLARGDDPADSLSSAPLGGTKMTPLLLTEDPNTLGSYSGQYLTANAGTLVGGTILGGLAAVSQAVQNQATADAQAPPSAPKLTAAAAVAGSAILQLSFNEPIMCSSVDANGSDFSVIDGSTADAVTAAACSSPTNGASATINLTVATPPAGGDRLTVTSKKGADGDTVKDANAATEAVGDSASTTAVIAPKLTGVSAVSGSTSVTATYNEAVVCSSVDANGSDYTVTVAGAADAVTAASCPGTSAQTVTLTLATAPSATGQAVAVTSATGADGNTVLDAGGHAEPVGDSVTANTTGTIVPTLSAASAGSTKNITLTYNEAITCATVDANGSDYTVSDTPSGGTAAADAPTAAACSPATATTAATVSLTVTTAPKAGDTVTITAQVGADHDTVVDPAHNAEVVGDHITATFIVPTFSSASAGGGTTAVTVSYDEPIQCASVDTNGSDYLVSNNGNADNPSAASCVNPTSGMSSTVTLTVPTAPQAGVPVAVAAQVGKDADTVLDANGSAQPVGDHVSTVAAVVPLLSAVASFDRDQTITLTLNEAVVCSSVDTNGSDYTVTDQAAADLVTAAACVGSGTVSNQVNLTLFTSPRQGDSVVVTAQAGSDGNTVLDQAGRAEPVGDQVTSTTAPGPTMTTVSASSAANTVTLTFSEALACSSVDTNGSDFSVSVNGTADTPTAGACSNPSATNTSATVSLTVPNPPSTGATVTVTAKLGSDGNTVLAAADGGPEPVGDTKSATVTAPAFSQALFTPSSTSSSAASQVTLLYSTPILCSSVDPHGANYSVTLNGSADSVNAASCTGTQASNIELTVGTAPASGSSTVVVTAQNPTVTDVNGNHQAIGDHVTAATVHFLSSTESAGGTTITLTYNTPVACSTVDSDASDYSLTVSAPTAPTLVSASCAGASSTTVTLIASQFFAPGEQVTVTLKSAGTDGNTVLDPYRDVQLAGDSTTHSV